MQKVINFLEQKVQFLAIFLGALFVFYMLYLYVLQPPAKVTVGNEPLTAGKVDEYILTNVGKTLEEKIQGQPEKFEAAKLNYVEAFKNAMSWNTVKPIPFAGIFPTLPPLPDLPTPGSTTPGGNQLVSGQPTKTTETSKVTALPVPPPATPAESKFGRSVVLLPDANGQLPPPPQPGQPAPAGVDKDWVTQLFHINIADLDAALAKSKIPTDFYKTVFLQVEMQRVELDDNGTPIAGTEKIVPGIPVYRSNTPRIPYPPEGQREAEAAFKEWAAANTPDILQPLFYTVAKGDQWTKPGAKAVSPETAFDPNQYIDPKVPIPAWVTPEQRQQINQAKQADYKRRQEEKAKSRPARPSGPRAPGGAPADVGSGFQAPKVDYAPAPGAHPPARPAAPPPGAFRPPDIGGGGYRPPDIGGEGGGGFAGAANTPASLPQPGTDYPNGEFNPGDQAAPWKGKNIEVWCHDETVEANKTYRYRLMYKIKNPVWSAGNVTEPAELADKFALASDWSSWSSPVLIPPLINFFVAASKSPNAPLVRFDVFKFEKGEQKSQSFNVGPGDQIGGPGKDGVDFSTDWTVVDFRSDPYRTEDWQILLINNKTGRLITRSFKGDSGDALFKALKEQVAAAKATETAASGAPGGAAPVLH